MVCSKSVKWEVMSSQGSKQCSIAFNSSVLFVKECQSKPLNVSPMQQNIENEIFCVSQYQSRILLRSVLSVWLFVKVIAPNFKGIGCCYSCRCGKIKSTATNWCILYQYFVLRVFKKEKIFICSTFINMIAVIKETSPRTKAHHHHYHQYHRPSTLDGLVTSDTFFVIVNYFLHKML